MYINYFLTVQHLNINMFIYCTDMKENSDNDNLNVLRKIQKYPKSSQRKLASDLGFSLGKLNYCLNALKEKGLIKIKNFRNNKNKVNYIYLLTPSGIKAKTSLTLSFMKREKIEFDESVQELINLYHSGKLTAVKKRVIDLIKKKFAI